MRHLKIAQTRYCHPRNWRAESVIHQLIHAGKLHLSGDANLKDQEGKFCGVKLERMTDGGWKVERML